MLLDISREGFLKATLLTVYPLTLDCFVVVVSAVLCIVRCLATSLASAC